MNDNDLGNDLPSSNDLDLQEESRADLPVGDRPAEPAPPPTLEDADSDLDLEPGTEQSVAETESDTSSINPHVHLQDPTTKPLKTGQNPEAWLSLPTSDSKAMDEVLANLPDDLSRLPQATREWLANALSSIGLFTRDGRLTESLNRGNWSQRPSHEGHHLTLAVPQSNKPAQGTILSGDDAAIHMARRLNLYGRIKVPLWHTGIWLDLDVPSDTELHLLEHLLAQAKYNLGYATKGLTYSNTMVMMNIELVNFVLDRVVGGSVKDLSRANLKKIIRVTDIPLLAWGLASAIHPTGFPYARSCTADPAKCTHIVRETLRLSKLIWVDTDALSPNQMKLMGRRGQQKTTDEELARYQTEFVNFGERKRELYQGISVNLTVPTLEQYELSGYEWVNGIINEATAMLGDMPTAQLEEFIARQSKLSTMRQYAHWVSSIDYADGVRVEDRDSIAIALEKASGVPEVVEAFIGAVSQYIDDSAVALVAVPKYRCPKCGEPQGGDEKHPHLIPLDAVHTFFILRDQKTRSTLLANMAH